MLYKGQDMNLTEFFRSPETAGVHGVIFDLDGSLVDSMWMWKAIDVEYLARFGIESPPNIQQEIGGRSMPQTADLFKAKFAIPDPKDKMMQDWDDMARHHYETDVPLKPGARAFLDWLGKAGIPVCVATSNSEALTRACLLANGVWDRFAAVVTGTEIPHGKPAPDVYLTAARKIGADPSCCIAIEDLMDGMRSARSAGMTVIGVLDEHSNESPGEKQKLADLLIRDFRDLPVGQEA